MLVDFEVDKLHQPPAEEIAQGVGVAGEDDLGALGLGVGDGARLDFGHGSILRAQSKGKIFNAANAEVSQWARWRAIGWKLWTELRC